MKALVKQQAGNGHTALMERPVPKIGPNEVLIAVKSVGVCGSDIKLWEGTSWSNPPVILGHEYAGVVEQVGAEVSGLAPGDRVLSETPQVICGKCSYCRNGRPMMCKQRLSIGYGVDGAFAEFIKIRAEMVHKLPDMLDFNTAALCEPLAVSVHAVFDSIPIHPADTVAVVGPGPIGQFIAQLVKLHGAKTLVFGIEADAARLALAKRLGADAALVTTASDFTDKLAQLAPDGLDLVFDCSGAPAAINQGLGLLRNMGTLVQVGLTPAQVAVDYVQIPRRELRLLGSFGHRPANWDQAIRLLTDGAIRTDGMIAGEFPLEDWEQAFLAMKAKKGIKFILHP